MGERHDRDELCARLAARGYRSAGMVARPGDLARRGGLIDLYAPGGRPLRVEFFDDEIVSLRTFDVESQRSVDRFDTVRILPVSHLVLDDDARLSALARAESAAVAAGLDAGERADLEAHLEDRGHGEGLEAFLPWFGPTALLTDHLSPGAPVFWLDPVSLGAQSELLDAELPRSREVRLRRDPALPEPGELVAPPAALADAAPSARARGRRVDHRRRRAGTGSAAPRRRRCGSPPRGPTCAAATCGASHAEIARREAAGERVLMLCDNAGQAERLGELLDETGARRPGRRAPPWARCRAASSGPRRVSPASPITSSSSATSARRARAARRPASCATPAPCRAASSSCTSTTGSASTAACGASPPTAPSASAC